MKNNQKTNQQTIQQKNEDDWPSVKKNYSDNGRERTQAGLSGCFRNRRFLARDIIYRESEPAERVFVIRSGIIKLLSYLPNGRARIVRLHGAGEWIGLGAVVGELYEHSAVAVGDVELDCLAMCSLHLLEREHPEEYCQILKQGYSHLSQADKWIADFSTGGIKPRVARLLNFLSEFEYGEASNMVELLTVHEMADMLGVTPESVSRILAEFKRNHTLNRTGSHPGERYVIDYQRLQYEARQ